MSRGQMAFYENYSTPKSIVLDAKWEKTNIYILTFTIFIISQATTG
jgi:hypothetical protein